MPSRKALILFFLSVAVVYGVLLIPWPGLLSGYRAAVAGTGNIFFRRIGDARITFETMDAPTLDKDIDVVLKNFTTGRTAQMSINARRLYLPTAFTLALILAAPIPWTRKLIALILGFTLISMYAGFSVWLKLIQPLSDPRGMAALTIAPFFQRVVMILTVILNMSPVTPYIAALLIFVLVTVRREDVVRLSSAAMKPRPAPSPATAV